MIWPDALVAELAARRCVVFMGAGASAGANAAAGITSPPSWAQLIGQLRARFERPEDKDVVEKLVTQERFLDVAEILLSSANAADFAAFVRDSFVAPRYSQSRVHESVLALDPKVVITTNWDDIYDRYCQTGDAQNGYNVAQYYLDNIVSVLRSPVRLVVKAHGCVTDPSKIVLSRSQYFAAKQRYSLFYRVLDSLFLTSTVLFLGYSLTDPDIQLVLENASIAARSSHPHYAVLPSGQHRAIAASLQQSYNIQILEYPAGDYAALNQGLAGLADLVEKHRIRFSA
jgi:hypothetical protein